MLSVLKAVRRGPPFHRSSPPAAIVPPELREVLLGDGAEGAVQAIAAALRRNRAPVAATYVTAATLQDHAVTLRAGTSLPVGGASFMRRAMQIAGIQEPAWNSFPRPLSSYMLHQPRRVRASVALGWPKPIFLKPVAPGLFRGFVLQANPNMMSIEANRQLDRLLALPRSTLVWLANALDIQSEWRYYVLQGEVLGYGPLTPQAAGAVEPEPNEVGAIVAASPRGVPFALDMAVLADGSTTMLTARDACGMDYPAHGGNRPSPIEFLRFLWARWEQLLLIARQAEAANSQPSSQASSPSSDWAASQAAGERAASGGPAALNR